MGERRLKSGLAAVVRGFGLGVRLTPNHDVLLTGILPEQRSLVEALLATYGVDVREPLSNIQLYSMACVALPTCGLAVAESERALPALVDELEQAAALALRAEVYLAQHGAQASPPALQSSTNDAEEKSCAGYTLPA